MRAHIIDENGIIINSIEVESLTWPDSFPESVMIIDGEQGGGIGDYWDGTKIIPMIQDQSDVVEEK